jgi:hypothetical protein
MALSFLVKFPRDMLEHTSVIRSCCEVLCGADRFGKAPRLRPVHGMHRPKA